VSTVLRDSDWIRVEVSDVAGGESIGLFGDGATNRAFAFNVAGAPAGVTITGLAPGFTLDQSGLNTGPFGTFEFVINGAASADDALLPLYFNVTRTGGFTSDRDLFDANAAGFLFHAHVRNQIRDVAGFAGAGHGEIHSLPEPASMVLLGTGLGALAFRRLRRAA
jgi:hypothetical protein